MFKCDVKIDVDEFGGLFVNYDIVVVLIVKVDDVVDDGVYCVWFWVCNVMFELIVWVWVMF